MAELSQKTKDALNGAATSTLTGLLNRRGFNNMFMQEVSPLRLDIPRMVGFAYTMRFIPHRKDKSSPLGNVQQKAMEECPPGHVLVVDSRGDARAASAGDLYIGRLAARGCSGHRDGWRIAGFRGHSEDRPAGVSSASDVAAQSDRSPTV